jgi:membrane protease YdiL (CAAX protease family)
VTSPAPDPPPEDPSPEPSPRLPLGTRISLYYILVFVLLLLLGPLLAALLVKPDQLAAWRAGEAVPELKIWLWIEALLAVPVAVATIGFVRLVDRKPLHAIGALWPPGRGGQAGLHLGAAVGSAAAILGVWYLGAGLVARFDVTASPEAPGAGELAAYALGFLAAAALEEWILRGYIYSALRERLSWVHAGGIAALLFVLPQLAGTGVTAPGLVSAFLLGMTLAALRELTGSLWTGVAFHGGWNFLMGCVLALPVSGNRLPSPRRVEVTGSEAWTGGAYGPEGSWLMVALLLLAVAGLAGVLGGGEESDGSDASDASDASD